MKNALKYAAIILLIIVAIAVFRMFFGNPLDMSWKKDLKQYQANEKALKDSVSRLTAENIALSKRFTHYKDSLSKVPEKVRTIKEKASNDREDIAALPSNKQVELLSSWLPAIDTFTDSPDVILSAKPVNLLWSSYGEQLDINQALTAGLETANRAISVADSIIDNHLTIDSLNAARITAANRQITGMKDDIQGRDKKIRRMKWQRGILGTAAVGLAAAVVIIGSDKE